MDQPTNIIGQLIISLRQDGNVDVQGPIANKVLCYGLLERAKDAIRTYEPDKFGILLGRVRNSPLDENGKWKGGGHASPV